MPVCFLQRACVERCQTRFHERQCTVSSASACRSTAVLAIDVGRSSASCKLGCAGTPPSLKTETSQNTSASSVSFQLLSGADWKEGVVQNPTYTVNTYFRHRYFPLKPPASFSTSI